MHFWCMYIIVCPFDCVLRELLLLGTSEVRRWSVSGVYGHQNCNVQWDCQTAAKGQESPRVHCTSATAKWGGFLGGFTVLTVMLDSKKQTFFFWSWEHGLLVLDLVLVEWFYIDRYALPWFWRDLVEWQIFSSCRHWCRTLECSSGERGLVWVGVGVYIPTGCCCEGKWLGRRFRLQELYEQLGEGALHIEQSALQCNWNYSNYWDHRQKYHTVEPLLVHYPTSHCEVFTHTTCMEAWSGRGSCILYLCWFGRGIPKSSQPPTGSCCPAHKGLLQLFWWKVQDFGN